MEFEVLEVGVPEVAFFVDVDDDVVAVVSHFWGGGGRELELGGADGGRAGEVVRVDGCSVAHGLARLPRGSVLSDGG